MHRLSPLVLVCGTSQQPSFKSAVKQFANSSDNGDINKRNLLPPSIKIITIHQALTLHRTLQMALPNKSIFRISLNSSSTQQTGGFDDVSDGLENARGRIRVSAPTQLCPANKVCPFGYACRPVTVTCAAEGTRTVSACIPACQNGGQCIGTCKLTSDAESKRQTFKAQDGTTQYQEKLSTGFCYPRQGTRALGCKYDPGTA